ncbi:unnamed protein product [Brassica rapa]|uniref:Autophagy-related protein n=2 Tax=Brassica TaxID=3705 RepID=A0A816W9X4_BRANA|nr:unnamed protein product [Brassica napus]CAG7883688.1 unnamed protein product [Brassica rapa]
MQKRDPVICGASSLSFFVPSDSHRFSRSKVPRQLRSLDAIMLSLYAISCPITNIQTFLEVGLEVMAKSTFKEEHDLGLNRTFLLVFGVLILAFDHVFSFEPSEKRSAEAARIREKYSDRIPVIVEKAEKSDIPTIDKKKYLVPADLTVGQFVYVIRKRIKLSSEKAIFIFVDNVLPPTGALMSAVYEEKKDDDGFLYVTYSGENTFGST